MQQLVKIRCRPCGKDNVPGVRSCANCGAALVSGNAREVDAPKSAPMDPLEGF
jgi:uncharacterized OB-fold protein